MLYHKAIRITRPEADYLIKTPTTSLNECVVIQDFGVWYDVRGMTQSELSDFVDCLHRAHLAKTAPGLALPN